VKNELIDSTCFVPGAAPPSIGGISVARKDDAISKTSGTRQRWGIDRSVLLLLGISFVSFSLRWVWLGEKSLWIDEIWSIGFSRMPWHAFLWAVRNQDPNTSLYYVLLHFWTLFGYSETMVRAMSVLFAVGTIPALYALGNRLFGKAEGLVASALLAVNAFHIQWSQEARGYSLVVLLVTLSSLLFVVCIERPSRKNWALYALVSVLAIYAHLYAALVLGSHLLSLIVLPRRKLPWKGLIGTAGVIGSSIVPLVILFSARAKDPFVPLGWLPKATFHAVYDVFYSLAGNAEFPGSHGGKSILIAYLVVCLIAILSAMREWHSFENSFNLWHLGLLLSWLFVPIASILAISMVQPMMMSRYLLICVPAITLLAARGIQSIRPRWVSGLVLVAVVTLAALRLPQYFHGRASFLEWKLVTDRVLAQARPGDAIIFCVAPGRLLFDYYRERYHSGADGRFDIVYPQFADENENHDPRTLDYLPPMSEGFVDSVAAKHDRVWLVVYHDHFAVTREASIRIEEGLAAKLPEVEKSRIDGVTLLLYARAPGAR
jgi:hypothetical protein